MQIVDHFYDLNSAKCIEKSRPYGAENYGNDYELYGTTCEMTLLLWYAYAKAVNDDETEVLCLKRIKTEPRFILFTFFPYIEICHWFIQRTDVSIFLIDYWFVYVQSTNFCDSRRE